MPNFDIVKKSDIDETFRVSKIKNDFDVKIEHADEIDYYKDKKSAVAIEIDQVVVFEKAIQYKEIDSVGKPPMSFKYIQ